MCLLTVCLRGKEEGRVCACAKGEKGKEKQKESEDAMDVLVCDILSHGGLKKAAKKMTSEANVKDADRVVAVDAIAPFIQKIEDSKLKFLSK